MSIKSNPSTVTPEQIDELEKLRIAYVHAQQTGATDLDAAREAYQDLALKLLIDLSGKLEPGPDQPPVTEPSKPTEGTVKEGGDQDPDNWHINPMRDDPSKFKIIDGNSKNIATDFSSVATAQEYIAYYRWQKVNPSTPLPTPPSPDSPPTPTHPIDGTHSTDQFGILCIKASAPSGKVETNFKLESKQRNYASGKPSEWSCEYTNVSKTPIENVEVTIYEKINGFKTNEPDSISIKIGGPNHSNGNCCWLIPDIMTDGSSKKTMETEFPHPKNHPVNPPSLFKIGESIVGKWIGYKGISQQTADGKRHVECWIHFPISNIDTVKDALEQAKWRKYITINIPDSRFFKASGNLTTSRLDGVKKDSLPEFKYASVREIVAA